MIYFPYAVLIDLRRDKKALRVSNVGSYGCTRCTRKEKICEVNNL